MAYSKEQIETLENSSLFKGISADGIEKFLASAGVSPRTFEAGTQFVRQGESQSAIHIVLSGRAVGERFEPDGRSVIVNEFHKGEVFGDLLSGTEEKSPVTVLMAEDGEVIKLQFKSLLTCAGADTATQERLLRNLMTQIAGKYFALQRRLDILLCPGLRGKISAYLLGERDKEGSDSFIVPHSREEQSRLLNCDRSALSRELSRMKKEGLIDYDGSRFEIKDASALGAA